MLLQKHLQARPFNQHFKPFNSQHQTQAATMTIQSNVFRGIEGVVKKVPLELPSELGPKQVLIKITHASLCGTDVHYIPHSAALGHEGIGIVEKIGSEVTQFKVGDRAGAGYLRNVSSTVQTVLANTDKVITELWAL
jgi:D-arabinose 1-dehydrogenase-like Zn-dependent alcohol dehydrogenase